MIQRVTKNIRHYSIDSNRPFYEVTEYATHIPHCGGEMRFLSVIEEPLVIERILRHLGLWDPRPPGQGPPDDDDWPVNGQIPLTYEPLPAIA